MLETFIVIAAFVTPHSKAPAPQADPPVEMLIKLTVDSMPVPRPALWYLLLPDLRDMTPGNPIPNYLKCLLDQDFSLPDEVLGKRALRHAVCWRKASYGTDSASRSRFVERALTVAATCR